MQLKDGKDEKESSSGMGEVLRKDKKQKVVAKNFKDLGELIKNQNRGVGSED